MNATKRALIQIKRQFIKHGLLLILDSQKFFKKKSSANKQNLISLFQVKI